MVALSGGSFTNHVNLQPLRTHSQLSPSSPSFLHPPHKQPLHIHCCSSKDDGTKGYPTKSEDTTKKYPDKSGAGKSWVSPDWLTSLSSTLKNGRDNVSGIPVASAKLEDVKELLGGALFLPLFKWMIESGPVYRLAAGPRDFVIVGDPLVAKHVLKNYGKYAKGLVAEVSEFLFGSGFAIAEGQLWTVSSSCGSRCCSFSSFAAAAAVVLLFLFICAYHIWSIRKEPMLSHLTI